jgi:hypothetical protein
MLRRPRKPVLIFLALAMLFAQAGALQHVYTHLQTTNQSNEQRGNAAPCNECVSQASLLASACAPTFAYAVVHAAVVLAPLSSKVAAQAAPLNTGYSSRAPPLQS